MGPPEQEKAPNRAEDATGGKRTKAGPTDRITILPPLNVKLWVWGWPDWLARRYSNSKGVLRGA